MSDVGTWAWAQRTHGTLSRRDQAELIRQGALAQLGRLPSRWRGALLGKGVSLALPEPPDSRLALAAEERVRELSSPQIHAHCLRTWLFAALFAQRDGVVHDPELLYLACVLHDLGLTDAHDGRDPTAACFAVEGARAAHDLLCAHGEPEDRAVAVAQAISLHLNVTVPARLGAEAHLLGKGVSLDVVGRRAHHLPRAAVEEVSTRWPREGFAEALLSATKAQAARRLRSRAALAHRLGFAGLVRGNPLEG